MSLYTDNKLFCNDCRLITLDKAPIECFRKMPSSHWSLFYKCFFFLILILPLFYFDFRNRVVYADDDFMLMFISFFFQVLF